LPAVRWPALLQALAGAGAARDIQIYDRRPTVESAAVGSHLDGGLHRVPGDFLAIVDDNRSYNKLNPYVQEAAEYRVGVRSNLWLDSTLAVHYHVAPSPAGLEGAGPGFGAQGSKHDYEDFLRVYVPAGARLLQTAGVDRWAPAPAYGLTQLAGKIMVREGESRTVTIHYAVPATVFSGTGFRRYQLTVRRQAGSNLGAIRVVFRSAGAGRDGPTGRAAPVVRSLRLTGDVHLEVPLTGSLRPYVVPTPKTSGSIDPYIPFADFHDPRHPL
jgi:hypothetical protein